jgi:hypothetical protein
MQIGRSPELNTVVASSTREILEVTMRGNGIPEGRLSRLIMSG